MSNTSLRPYTLAIKQLHNPLQMWLHDQRDQHVSKGIAEQGNWEAYETELFIERIHPQAIVVDVGANIGYYSLIAADQLQGGGQVFAFEPDAQNFALLEKNLHENALTHVQAVNAALSNESRSGHLFLSENNFGDHQIYNNGENRQQQKIELVNGGQYLHDKITRIDLLKIDTQGAEYGVVAGLMPLLKASGQGLSIIIEFWPYGLRRAGASAQQLLDLLTSLELPMAIIDHLGHNLLPCSEEQLRGWVDMVEADLTDEGFMNILIGR